MPPLLWALPDHHFTIRTPMQQLKFTLSRLKDATGGSWLLLTPTLFFLMMMTHSHTFQLPLVFKISIHSQANYYIYEANYNTIL
jgi:hypothetical protein